MNPRTMLDGGMEAQTEDKPNFYVDNIVFVHTSTHFVGVSFRTLGICRRSGPPFQIYLVSQPHGVIALNRKETT
jgi:hypothetical protein